jgi:hypothetical protein
MEWPTTRSALHHRVKLAGGRNFGTLKALNPESSRPKKSSTLTPEKILTLKKLCKTSNISFKL